MITIFSHGKSKRWIGYLGYKVKATVTYFVSNALFRAKKIKLDGNSTDKSRVAMSWDFSNSFSPCFLSNELGIKIHSLDYDISYDVFFTLSNLIKCFLF